MTQATVNLSDWAVNDGSPTPPLNMIGTYYGVTVNDVGEDGDAFALGHVGRYRALAAFMRHARENRGDDLFWHRPMLLGAAVKRVQYLWMVNLGSDETWLLREAEPSDPGAFPVTWWDA
jgi:hypothetical protein